MSRTATCAAVAVLFLYFSLAPGSYAGTITDNFNDNSLNTAIWGTGDYPSGGPGSVTETNQRIEMVMPANTGSYTVYLTPLFQIGGDFDLQIDYALLAPLTGDDSFTIDWSPGIANIFVGRTSGAYGAEFGSGGPVFSVPTLDVSGTLRLTRTGATYSGYFWNGTGWQLIGSISNGSTSDSMSILGLGGQSGGQVALDNFYLNADRLTSTVPEPTGFLLSAGALLGGLLARKFAYT